MKLFKAIIIEDEAPARDLLNHYLGNHKQIQVVAQCNDGFEGIKAISAFKPDIIFLDVQMPRISGFEMLELLDEEQLPLIIFTTAFDKFAIKAFEYNALDYLLKPIGKERFDQAVIKALEKLSSGQDVSASVKKTIESVARKDGYLDRIVLRSGAGIHVIPHENIQCIEAMDDYVMIITNSNEEYLKKKTLKYYEENLDPRLFLRVHRSCIVAIEAIQKIEPYSKDAWVAILNSGKKVSVSKAGYAALRRTFDF